MTRAAASSTLILLLACASADHADATRDWRTWPFAPTSPWNHPIGSGARYAPIRDLASYPASINYDDRWTSAVVIADDSDPTVEMLFSPPVGESSTWTFLANGGQPCGNSPTIEAPLEAASSPALAFEGNYYSTISRPDTHRWLLPADYHRASQDARPFFRLPAGACPSPDSDGFMAVFQPDGWAVDIYASVVLSDGKVLGTMASSIDARGDGTGWWNGRRASMLPSFAGLIRNGEIANGRIPHALVVQAPPAMLKRRAVWPAFAFDRDAGYSGRIPMGALLAIPAWVDIDQLGLSTKGKVIARAAQDYGVYVADRGGSGITFLAELGNTEIRWPATLTEPAWWTDIAIIKSSLMWVRNNRADNVGGGGTPRAPFAPPFADQ